MARPALNEKLASDFREREIAPMVFKQVEHALASACEITEPSHADTKNYTEPGLRSLFHFISALDSFLR